MLDQVINKLEANNTGGTVRASIINDCIDMLEGEEGYRAQKARELLIERVGLSEGKANPEPATESADEEVPVEHSIGALRALFESQDD